MELDPRLIQFLLFAPVILISLSIHEWGHAYSAHKLGDHTANNLGRMTINPIPHISLVGTIIVPIVTFMAGFPFGWANPVPVDPRNFKDPHLDLAIVAAAGPFTNIILAILSAFAFSLLPRNVGFDSSGMVAAAKPMLMFSIQINLVLCFFNMVPLHPLDGSRILPMFLNHNMKLAYIRFSQYSSYVLLGMIVFGGFSFLRYPVHYSMNLLFKIFGVY